ncbi:MAG: four helix bundle protein [Pirellulales bacterium]
MQIEKCKLQIAESPSPKSNGDARLRPDDLCERFLDFADRVCSVVEALPDTRIGRRIADQLLRSGTSPLGNYEEACAAESKGDFAHKLGICLKEVRESRAWLRLAGRRDLVPATRLTDLIDEADQLARIVGQSIATVRRTAKKQHQLGTE